jgi:hypothetical protein
MFTLEEAQTLVPVLGALLLKARDAALRASVFENEMAELSQRIFLSGGMHVDVAAAATRRAEREKALAEARSTIEEIEEIGARVAETEDGALEFPSMAEGRVVLLCWSLGEDDIERWREDEPGSALQRLEQGPFGRDRERLN